MNEFTTTWAAEFARALQRLDAVTAGLNDAAANHKVNDRTWSVAQCIDHLRQAIETYLPFMESAVARVGRGGVPTYGGTYMGRFILYSMRGGPQKFKVPAMKVFRPSSGPLVLAETAKALREVIGRVQKILAQTDGLDIGRMRFGTPASPLVRVSMAQALEIHALHLHRHLDQAERARAAALAAS